jgi:hypothetical protein
MHTIALLQNNRINMLSYRRRVFLDAAGVTVAGSRPDVSYGCVSMGPSALLSIVLASLNRDQIFVLLLSETRAAQMRALIHMYDRYHDASEAA